MNALVINKISDSLFSLVLNGGDAIISEQNRLTTKGNFCNFKTANGANLILKQNILVSEITLNSGGTFTFVTVASLWSKLIEVGFFNGVAITSGSVTVFDEFTKLTDTFTSYLGRDGQILVVNESSQKIESITIALFTNAEKTKLEGIETGAQVNVQANLLQNDPSEDDFVFGKETLNSVVTSVVDILSSALATQTSAGMATWINANSFAVATNEIRQFHVTDTGQVFELLLRGRNFGSATPAISYIDVLDYGSTGVSLSANNIWTGIQTYLNRTLGLRNVADTFTSFFTNTNTASRTYNLPNRSMTVAGTDDIAITSLDEGNGIGYVISGRNAANYGSVGLGAVDLSTSDSASSTKGATAPKSTVSGGLNNTAENVGAVVGGGESNLAASSYDTIGGGNLNTITGSNSTIGGGQSNTINAGNATIGGGNSNNVSSSYGVISGGLNNTLTAIYAAIIGGNANNANGDGSISGGVSMTSASYAEIALGTYGTNYTAGSTSAIVGTDRILNIGNGAHGGARSNAFTILKNGLATLPSVTNELITAEATGKAVVTKEYVSNVMRNIVKDVVVSATITGVASDTEVKAYLIPSNSFSANDILTMYCEFNKAGAVGTATYKFWKNTTNNFAGATQIAMFTTVAGNLTTKMARNFTLRGGNMMGNNASSSLVIDLSSNSNTVTTTAFDTTVNNYIFVSIALAGAADTAFVSSVKINN